MIGQNLSLLLGYLNFISMNFALRIVESIIQGTVNPHRYNLPQIDLIQRIRDTWDRELLRIFKIKSHRSQGDATNPEDLYYILGNTVADETAKLVNRQDISPVVAAASNIQTHSHCQMKALISVYKYLIDLNTLHLNFKLEKEKQLVEEGEHSGVDTYSSIQNTLQN